MRNTLLIVLCSATLLLSSCACPRSQHNAWEYKYFDAHTSDVEKRLNDLAKDGWIVVSSSAAIEPGFAPKVQVILKRPTKAQ